MNLGKYAKAVPVVLAAVVIFLQSGISDDGISKQEWLQVAVEAFGAFGVWLTANWAVGSVVDKWAKFITAAGYAGLVALAGFLVDENLSSSELTNVIIAAVAAVLVGGVGNDPSTLARPASGVTGSHT